jgi:hypothetical protein
MAGAAPLTEPPGATRRRPVQLRSGLALTCVLSCLAGCRGTEPPPHQVRPVPPLSLPTGDVIRVASVSELQRAVREARSNSTILLQSGRFRLTEPLRLGGTSSSTPLTDVSLRGATGDRNDVVIEGRGVEIGNVQGMQVADMTFANVAGAAIHVRGEDGAERPHVYNVRFVDATGQMLRATAAGDRLDGGIDRGIVEYSVFEYTDIPPTRGSANGVAVYRGTNWIIKYNTFRNIRAGRDARETLRPAVVARDQSENTYTHNNLFIDCERAIAYGMGEPDGPATHAGGAIYNNFIYRRRGFARGDAGIMLWGATGTKVYHNTIIQNGTYQRAIEYRFASTKAVDIRNNLTDGGIEARNRAQGVVAGNYVKATLGMFRNPSSGDLRLMATAEEAIDEGVVIAEWPYDWDGDTRPLGGRPDIGADEYQP